MQYNFDLDMNSRNSNSVIIGNIRPNSDVLEIGPAYGRMTKFLNEKLNCRVDIIEINARAGKEASKYASHSNIGVHYGNIEKRAWLNRIKSKKYHYVIFADVLEHLNNPEKALSRTSEFLHKNGQIWISVPNVSHNAVLIDLLNDKFEYRDFGLLDRTHIRFFTESSLKKMIDNAGLKILAKENLVNVVENTEFNNKYSDLSDDISQFLRTRKNGEVYQFVWGLAKK